MWKQVKVFFSFFENNFTSKTRHRERNERKNKEKVKFSRLFTIQAGLIRSRRSFLLRLDKDRKDAEEEEEVEALFANPDLEWKASVYSPGKAGRRVLEGYVRRAETNP